MNINGFFLVFFLVFCACKSREESHVIENNVDFSNVYIVRKPLLSSFDKAVEARDVQAENIHNWVIWSDETRNQHVLLAEMKPSYVRSGLSLTEKKKTSSWKSSDQPRSLERDSERSSQSPRISKSVATVDYQISKKIENYTRLYEHSFAVEDTKTQGGRGYLKEQYLSDVELTRVLTSFSIGATKDFGFDVVTTAQLGGLQDVEQQGSLSVRSILGRMKEKENYSVLVQIPERLHWVGLHKSGGDIIVFDSLGSSSKTLELGYGVQIPPGKFAHALETARLASLAGRGIEQVQIEGVRQDQMSVLIRQWNFKHMLDQVAQGGKVLWIEKPHQTEDGWRCGYHQLEAAYRNSHGKSMDLNREDQDQRFLTEFLGPGKQYEQLAGAVETVRLEFLNRASDLDIDSSPVNAISQESWSQFGEQVKPKIIQSSSQASWAGGIAFFALLLGGGAGFYAVIHSWFEISDKAQNVDEFINTSRSLPPNLLLIKKEQGRIIGYDINQEINAEAQFIGTLEY